MSRNLAQLKLPPDSPILEYVRTQEKDRQPKEVEITVPKKAKE